MSKQFLALTQIILGLLIIGLIILQSKGTGMGSTFGGDMGFYGTKRGAEKILFITTIVISTLFMITLIVGIFF